MLDRLRAMAVFAKTVETGSFRGAARALGLSPSVVSHHVTQLEASLDVALLYRTTRRLTLTDDGKKLFAAAREMVAAAERGLGEMPVEGLDPSGHLSIAIPAALIAETLYEDLAAFAQAFPRIALTLHSSDAQVDIIREGIDVALRAGVVARVAGGLCGVACECRAHRARAAARRVPRRTAALSCAGGRGLTAAAWRRARSA